MTVQSQDKIDYYGRTFNLLNYPLSSFLNANQQIVFDEYHTAAYRGYECHWSLYGNKLFLLKLDSSNHSIETIFKNVEVVLADWYSGILTICTSENAEKSSSLSYARYLEVTIKNGIAIERKIFIKCQLDSIFSRNDLTGMTLGQIILGKVNEPNYKLSLNLYLEYLLSFILNNKNFKASFDYKDYSNSYMIPSDINELEILEFIKNSSFSQLKYLISNNTIMID